MGFIYSPRHCFLLVLWAPFVYGTFAGILHFLRLHNLLCYHDNLSIDLEGVFSAQDDDDTPFFQIFPLDGLRATRGFAGGDVKSDHFSILYLSPAGRCLGIFFTDGIFGATNVILSLN
ncbi:hypothetical protein IEQ34_007751 [Dendrobium chrysotoxum]|uniref:Uncharacterized protein n=1 Tax=Dendrobium chrysotoxum TaxID=161865 RepID=A0AAV7GMZ1_DENCH|nr:hypothetical protein IEQ34_007751 [Dendrobium chrysotoxum]